ncbi:hypothetical protein RS9916_36297 [Synechococcus sp. RS9916]|nr:hypothetical protein RS9916_36297 [Synechococcus sp. RS9916]
MRSMDSSGDKVSTRSSPGRGQARIKPPTSSGKPAHQSG